MFTSEINFSNLCIRIGIHETSTFELGLIRYRVPSCFPRTVLISQRHKMSHTPCYNRRQNEMRHLALKGLFDVFLTSKGKNIAFSPPPPPPPIHPLHEMLCRCSSYLKKTITLNGGDRGGGWIILLSEVTLFEYNISTILSPIVALKGNLGHNVDTGETAVYRAASVRVILLYAFPRYWPYRRVGSVRFSAEMVPGSCPFAHRIKKV